MSDGLNDGCSICADAINAQPRTDRPVGRCLAMVARVFTEIQPLKMFALLLTLQLWNAFTTMNDNVKTFYETVKRLSAPLRNNF